MVELLLGLAAIISAVYLIKQLFKYALPVAVGLLIAAGVIHVYESQPLVKATVDNATEKASKQADKMLEKEEKVN